MSDPSTIKSHEYLKSVTIGKPQSAKDGIIIVDYDPNWPIVFESLKKDIDHAFKDIPHQVEHVGSTSVPGLCAKPIIDMVLTISNPKTEDAYVPLLQGLGYRLRIREDDWYDHRMLKLNQPQVNLHVFGFNCPEVKRMLDFRDWLTTHPDDMALYGSTKRRLATQSFEYVQDYADAKSDVVSTIFSHIDAGQ